MAGERAGELVGAERLEEPGRREVASLAVPPGQRVVGDLPDEGLDEGILAPLGRPRIRLEGQGARAERAPQPWLEQRGLGDARHRRQAGEREALAEDRGVGDTRARSSGGRPSRRLAMRAVSVLRDGKAQ